MTTSAAAQDPSRAFVVALFVVAIVVGALIAYFGITGRLGAGIP